MPEPREPIVIVAEDMGRLRRELAWMAVEMGCEEGEVIGRALGLLLLCLEARRDGGLTIIRSGDREAILNLGRPGDGPEDDGDDGPKGEDSRCASETS